MTRKTSAQEHRAEARISLRMVFLLRRKMLVPPVLISLPLSLFLVARQGTSDPVVYVEAFGQKFATNVKQACLSCVFDETFVISLRNVDKDVFEEGIIR